MPPTNPLHRLALLILTLAVALTACTPTNTATPPTTAATKAAPTLPPTVGPPQTLRLATTTSTADSGLLDAILPDFETRYNATVDVIAVGTGQALTLGTNGDVDVVLVHARAKEDQFVAAGDGLARFDVMYNDFVLVGPTADPAHIATTNQAKQALTLIAAAKAPFASRGDESGTHTKEKSLWSAAKLTPTVDSGWYFSLGQGMGETLIFANEKGAYTLADRGTWLAQQSKLPDLKLLVGGAELADNKDKALLNPYGVIAVNPAKHTGINAALAQDFITWLTSVDTQTLIGAYGRATFGQPLFYPDSQAWRNRP